MKNILLNIIPFFFIGFAIIFFTSCREEIIIPNNPVGNFNQPLKNSFSNSYDFLIDAKNLTVGFSDTLEFRPAAYYINIKSENHSSGFSDITVFAEQNQMFFTHRVYSSDVIGYSFGIGKIPKRISITFNNFTGQLRVQLIRINN